MNINVSLVQYILNLKKEYFDNLYGFINDFTNDFYGKNINYWEYEAWAKKILNIDQIEVSSTMSFFKEEEIKNYNFDRKIIYKYMLLLKEIFTSDMFTSLYCQILNENDKKSFLLFLSYLNKNYSNKDKIIKCLQKMSNIGIYEFTYNPDFNFDGIYNIKLGIALSEGIFSDCNKNWLSRFDTSFPISIEGANYIIEYHKYSNSGIYMTMKLKNLDFDIDTLPTKKVLLGLGTSYPGIDYQVVNVKTDATDLVYKLDSCIKLFNEILEIYEKLVKDLKKIKTKEECSIIKEKLFDLIQIKEYLEQLKSFLILQYNKQSIIESSELKDSINRKQL